MFVAAVGMGPAVTTLTEWGTKIPLPLRRPLTEMDLAKLAPFRRTSAQELPPEEKADIGTDQVILWMLKDTEAPHRSGLAGLFVTYYSGAEEQVPHTPEVCYPQHGGLVLDLRRTTIDVPKLGPSGMGINVRVLHLKIAELGPDRDRLLMYVFCVNGRFRHDREFVRLVLANPFRKCTYFSKIEVYSDFNPARGDAQAEAACKRLLASVLPVLLEDHYPVIE